MSRNILMTVLFIILSGCATIPPEASSLSRELGQRISALEQANLTLLHKYFEQKKMAVDRFIEEVWLPEFEKDFFQKPFIETEWNTIVSENDKLQRLKFLMRIGSELQKAINQKRLELIQPLDDLEKVARGNIKFEYENARNINHSLTDFLQSAAEIAASKQDHLKKIVEIGDKLATLIDRTDVAVSDLFTLGFAADSTKNFIKKINEIKKLMK